MMETTWTDRRHTGATVPTVGLEDDSDVILYERADIQQHSGRVHGAETELNVVSRVVVAQTEVVVMGVDPVGPRCLV